MAVPFISGSCRCIAYCNIIVGRAEAVALDKDLVCSGQSGRLFILIQMADHTEQGSCMFRAV